MIRLEKVLKNGGISTEKEMVHRLKRAVENSARPVFGGVALRDLTFSFPLSVAYVVCFLSVFTYLIYTNIKTTLDTEVLSLDQNAHGMTCRPIVKSLKGQWNADANGNWDSENDFTDESSLFVFTAKGQKIGKKQYEDALTYFRQEIDKFAEYAGSRTMAWNLIMLSSLTFSHKDSGLQFCLSTDASLIYDTLVKVATLSNENGICLGYNSDAVSTSNARRFLSASYKTEEAALTLELPLRINVSSIMGANTNKYSITFTPAVEEPCPQHGQWFKHLFYGADAAFRDGFADIGFDVRSTVLAIALNLGRVGTSSLVRKDTEMTRAIGMYGLVDPYYTFPHMARIYCVNKNSEYWTNYTFSPEEKKEQAAYFDETEGEQADYVYELKYPNICFVVSVDKLNAIQFFYPMVSMLKWDRDPCYDKKPPAGKQSACPDGTPLFNSFTMIGCKCPADKVSPDCNRQSLYTSYYYDTKFQSSMPTSTPDPNWKSSKDRIKTDSAIMLGIAMQKDMLSWKYPDGVENWKKGGRVNNDYDVKAMQRFDSIVATTVSVWNNPTRAELDPSHNAIPALTAAWKNLQKDVENGLRQTNIKSNLTLSAIVLRSYGSIGAGNIILPINKFNMQLSELKNRSKDNSTYWDFYPAKMLPATACANPFNFDEAFNQMTGNPPVELQEKYFSCKRNVQTTLIMAVGTAYSSTNVMATVLWTIFGFLTIWGWKRFLKSTGSKEAVVSNRTKERLESLFTALKDESLVSVVDDLLGVIQTQDARLKALEARSGGAQRGGEGEDESEVYAKLRKFYLANNPLSQSTEPGLNDLHLHEAKIEANLSVEIQEWRSRNPGRPLGQMLTEQLLSSFYSLYDSKGQEEDDERLGKLLSKEANEDMATQMEGFQNICKQLTECRDWAEQKLEGKVVAKRTQRRTSAYHGQAPQEHGQLEVEMHNRHDEQDRGINEYDGDGDNNEGSHQDEATFYNPQHPPHPFSCKPSRRDSQGPAQPLPAASPAAAAVPSSSYDVKVVASNLRRLSVLSQRGGLAGVGAGAGAGAGAIQQVPPQMQRHPMATVLSGIAPPAATDLSRRESTRK